MSTFDLKIQEIKELFTNLASQEERYEKIIEMGRALSKLPESQRIAENVVPGCQSVMHLHSDYRDGKVYFTVDSDALISSGLAAILLAVYSGETPESILKNPPDFLEELGIQSSLTPSRSNGLYSIHLKMKQDALHFLTS